MVKAHHRVLTNWKQTPPREGNTIWQFCVGTKKAGVETAMGLAPPEKTPSCLSCTEKAGSQYFLDDVRRRSAREGEAKIGGKGTWA
jgi:hypothetical protein